MKGICCICREKIAAEKLPAGRVVASFRLQHYGLCPACQGRTRAGISRAYGQLAPVLNGSSAAAPEGAGV